MGDDRLLLVFDGTSWFLRRLRAIEHDALNEKVYRCDKHLGGPYSFGAAVEALALLAGQPLRAVNARAVDGWRAVDCVDRDAVLDALRAAGRRAGDAGDDDGLRACRRAHALLADAER